MEKPRRGRRRRKDVTSMRFILSISITNYTQKWMESKSKLGESCCKGVQELGEFYVKAEEIGSCFQVVDEDCYLNRTEAR